MKLEGIFPATILPMKADFSIDLESYEKYIQWMLSFPIGGLAINVDTGEGFQLTREEQRAVVKKTAEVVKKKVPIIAGVTGGYTKQAVIHAQDAEECGADALLIFSPPVFSGKVPPKRIALTYYQDIARAVNIPLVIFQLSGEFGGVEFSQDTLLKLIEMEGVTGIKEASFNIRHFQETLSVLRAASEEISILTGNDHFIFESFLLGADGGLLGLSSMSPGLHVDLFNAVQKKEYDLALQLRDKIQLLAHTIYARPFRHYRTRAKEALVLQKVIPAAHVRPPLLPISREEVNHIADILTQVELI
ncbi:MAG: dihydrodipicolinate synthase family protein [Theionarchaea archaeon]|nr:dihydrodipicolinate synthase family protein [Theionarchaea archaeon]